MARPKKKKFYVVWVGARPGVYTEWAAAEEQVRGYAGAKFKSFSSLEEANRALHNGGTRVVGKTSKPASPAGANGLSPKPAPRPRKSVVSKPLPPEVLQPSISVDAACSGNPGAMEYQGVNTATKERFFHKAFPVGTNNIGEFLGIVHALAWCAAKELPDLPIYTDSKIAMGWVAKKKCKTTLARSPKTAKLLDLVARGEAWLSKHSYRNPIVKWPTKRWGEIPADFGRK